MREKTYHLYLNEEERSRVIQSLIELKNNLAAQGRYTDAVDDDKYTGFHISDLNTALELNMGAETIRINIQDQEAEIKNNFDKLLQYVADKRKSAELHERQKYNYYCDRQAGCWNWTKEQDEAYQKEWDDIIIQMHALKDLENAMNLARTKGII